MRKINYRYLFVALTLIALSMFPVLFMKSKATEKFDVLYFGDSIVAGWNNEKPIPERLAENTGMSVFNGGFGGMTMTRTEDEQYISDRLNLFTMVSISEAIKDNDFSLQSMSSGRDSEQIIEYWSDRAESLSHIDLSNVRYVIIEFGANDFFTDVAIDNEADSYDLTTFAGALRYSVNNIKSRMPGACIILESPIYNAIFADTGNVNGLGLSIKEYVDIERIVAEELGVYFIDTFELSGINAENAAYYFSDGLHTNTNGDILISDIVTDFINSLE